MSEADKIDRSDWTKEEYAKHIHTQITGSMVIVCVLLKELKEKFFASETDTGTTWTKFCKENVGLSRQAVAGYLRIGKYVLPRIPSETADKLGTRKLLELAKLEDNADWDSIINEIHADMSFKQVRYLVERYLPERLVKERPRKSVAQLKKSITTLDEDLTLFIPGAEDADAKQKFKELANQLINDVDSLINVLSLLKGSADV